MRFLPLIFLLIAAPLYVSAQQKDVKLSGDILAVGLPAAALAISCGKKDMSGIKQLVLAEGTAVAATYLLKFSICKERPDGSNRLSFPSAHSAVSFTGATYLMRRYGWQYGVPAYLLSSYVAWSRTYANKHDWWDVSAGAALGVASALIYTRPFVRNKNITLAPATLYNKPAVYFSIFF